MTHAFSIEPPSAVRDDVTRSGERLQAVTAALSAATTLEEAAQVGVEQIAFALEASAGAVAVVDAEHGLLRVVSLWGISQARVTTYREIPLTAHLPVCEAVRTGRPVLLDCPAAMADAYPELVPSLDPQFKAWCVFPFVDDDRAVGVAWFLFHHARAFSRTDESLMMTIGRQAALAIARAQLFEAERSARRRVERLLDLTRRLEEVTHAVSRAMSIEATADVVVGSAKRAFDAISASLYVLEDDGQHLASLRSAGVAHDTQQRYARIPMTAEAPLIECVRTAQPLWIGSTQEHERRFPLSASRLREVYGAAELSFACVPLLVEGRCWGAFVYVFADATWPGDEDVRRFMALFADHCALALARARAFEREKTARAIVEEALGRAQRADQRKDEFLAMLGHELRNPLAPIVTALELARSRGDGSLVRELAVIERQVSHLERLVDDLLDLSRVTRGKVELDRRSVSLAEVVSEALDVTSPLLEQKRHHVEVDVSSTWCVVGDRVRLCQVLTNVLSNAAKYTEPGGHIVVQARSAGDQIELSVRDDGIGIAPDLLPSVFEMFVQAPQSMERSRGGLGLGLTISKRLIELHHGSIEAHSDGPGHGTRMIIRLPRSDAEASPRLRSTTPPVPLRALTSHRVLVVDDNEDAAMLLAQALTRLGHVVRTAYDGPSALELAKELEPEIVCLDIGLPVMDGYEVAERLRKDHPRPMRIIAITGYGQEQDRVRAREAGFHRHLVKPVDLHSILAAFEDE